MTNIEFARQVLNRLFESGVDEIVLCPGARNAPFVELLAHWEGGRVHSFFEERSAAFFALGRIAESGRPKAVITTSGTAVANCLPAVIEAHYTGAPLVAVTADRPRSYRGTGSPQTIVQPGIFSEYAPCTDLAINDAVEFQIHPSGPTHLNICFDEPLIDNTNTILSSVFGVPCTEHGTPSTEPNTPNTELRMEGKQPFVVVGGLSPKVRPAVLEWLARQECPVYVEAPSGLRGHPALKAIELRAGEKIWKTPFFDSLIRIGHVPTARVWRDMEKSAVPVVSFSELPFSGLAKADVPVFGLRELPGNVLRHSGMKAVLDRDAAEWERLNDLLTGYPSSEPALVRAFSEQIASTDTIYLGNSLPIREWDMAAQRNACIENCFANRGVNGIDGQLSTFFGWATPERRNWALVGDLTALYDLSAPWALRSRPLKNFTIGIINNAGGRIFQPMFDQPLFENRHALTFMDWAKMWNLEYQAWDGTGPFPAAQIIEIRPDPAQTEAVKQKW